VYLIRGLMGSKRSRAGIKNQRRTHIYVVEGVHAGRWTEAFRRLFSEHTSRLLRLFFGNLDNSSRVSEDLHNFLSKGMSCVYEPKYWYIRRSCALDVSGMLGGQNFLLTRLCNTVAN